MPFRGFKMFQLVAAQLVSLILTLFIIQFWTIEVIPRGRKRLINVLHAFRLIGLILVNTTVAYYGLSFI